MTLAGADGRVSGKLVDLDPQQQSVSEIWGLKVRLIGQGGNESFTSDYRVAPFIDLWRRQQGESQGDQTLASCYQSVLDDVEWADTGGSRLLEALRSESTAARLSISFNVFGFKMDPRSPEFTLGNIVGTIGPARTDEPAQFVLGRQMMATLTSPVSPSENVYNFPCVVDEARNVVTADLGNALPISDGDGTLLDVGALELALLKDDRVDNGDSIPPIRSNPLAC